jgi:hypothetical protein
MARFLNKTLFSDTAANYDNSRASDGIQMSGMSVYSVIASWVTTAAGAADTFDSAKTASKAIEDLTFTADTAGAAGNSITVEYLDSVKASLVVGDVTFTADAKGTGGNAISVALAGTGFGSQEAATAVGNAITVAIQGSNTFAVKTCNGGQSASKVIQDLTFSADARGTAGNSITVTYVAAAKATGTVTITDHESLIEGTADSVTVGTIEFTAQVGASTPGAATFTAQTSNDATAASLAAQINAHATAGTEVVAVAVGAVVTITHLIVGTSGNTHALAYTQNGAAVGATVSGAALAGGTGDVAGSEAVTVASSAISVIIESGVSTATQVKTAIDADGSAAALVNISVSGTGSNAQTAIAVQTLTGGTESAIDVTNNTFAISAHGYENGARVRVASTGTLPNPLAAGTDYWVVEKASGTFKVSASFGGGAVNITDQGAAAATITVTPRGSTAAEIKTACDAGGAGVTSLIDVVGTSSNSQVTAVAASLAGGLGGTAGNETVTVVGSVIKVYLETGVSTATQVKAKVDASSPAAALVDVSVTGTGSDAQVVTAATALEGGVDSEINLTTNVITIPSHGIPSGARGQLTTTGTLPAGLALLTDYFVIVVSANSIKLASSYDNAIAGVEVDITDDGSENGVHTFTQVALGGSIQPQVTNDDPADAAAEWTNFGSATAISGSSSAILYAPVGTSLPAKFPFNGVRFVVANTGGGIAMNAKFHGKE